uniref:Extracellular nuclease n=1 Tax=Trepomonas sp. PC1 TaxID=1076344 RepID=A0A146K5M2_9EUKA|eukprot:JAP90861.1 Extracellular nuclease [Trepomonas sp. PC1]
MIVIYTMMAYYPGKTGADLRKLLKTDCEKNQKTLGYTRAREEMYGYIYNDPKLSAVYCVYSGSKMPCEYDSMDTQCNKQLNCEHTVPQSFFGKKSPMVCDLHHMRATWSTANGARSDYYFSALTEDQIASYYGSEFQTVQKRPKDYQNWSALQKGTAFEPRDAQKGDTARAVAYFYTRYPTEAGSITKTFASVDDMITWDEQFAPSALQMEQYKRAVEVQGNINPFMLERHLVARAYCDMSKNYNCNDYK